MIKIKNITGLFLGVVILCGGCNSFLDLRPEGSIPAEGIDYSNSENIFLSVSAAYASLRTYGTHALPYVGLFEVASDNADKGSVPSDNPTMEEIDQLKYGANNSLVDALWVDYFNAVSAANYAINQMPLFVDALQSQENKEYARQCQAEAKFLRAYAYFNLTRVFGRVPLVDTTMTSGELSQAKQASTEELYRFIEQDLEEAVAGMPESYSKEWAGRVTKYSAMALKAKVHLYQNEWDSVAVLTDKVIASRKFDLLPDFREVFSIDGENGRESLFEIQSSTMGQISGPITYLEYAYCQGPRGNSPSNMQGWGFCTPSQDLISFFNQRGEVIRPATTLLYRGTKTPEGDSIKSSCDNPVYNGKVYTPSSYNNWNFNGYGFDHNVRILRYADVLLMFAEAKVNGAVMGTTSGYTADEALNKVRRRAGLADASATLQAVYDERRAELAMEEDRFFDLIRTGQAQQAMAKNGKNFVTGKHEYYPIPSNQKQTNNTLEQNPGYTF